MTGARWRYAAYAASIAGLGWAVLASPAPTVEEKVSEALPLRARAQGVRQGNADRRASPVAGDGVVLALVPRQRIVAGASSASRATAFTAVAWSSPGSAASAAAGPAPPAAPPFAYVGRQLVGERWQVLVADKDAAPRTVEVGEIVDDEYRVVSINADAMVVDYLPSHTQYSIPLE